MVSDLITFMNIMPPFSLNAFVGGKNPDAPLNLPFEKLLCPPS